MIYLITQGIGSVEPLGVRNQRMVWENRLHPCRLVRCQLRLRLSTLNGGWESNRAYPVQIGKVAVFIKLLRSDPRRAYYLPSDSCQSELPTGGNSAGRSTTGIDAIADIQLLPRHTADQTSEAAITRYRDNSPDFGSGQVSDFGAVRDWIFCR